MRHRGRVFVVVIGACAAAGCLDDPEQRPPSPSIPPNRGPARDAGAAGAAGAAAPADAPDGPFDPGVSPNGQWGLFGFEDPVAIDAIVGSSVGSLGCYAGLPRDPLQLDFGYPLCTPLEDWKIDGRHVEFSFMAQQYRYAADVMISADATRMAGHFHGTGGWHESTAWLRIEPGEVWVKYHGGSAMHEALKARGGSFDLKLEQGEVPGVFAATATYWLSLVASNGYGPYIGGDLGAFWGDEMQWDEATATLRVGPVPETDPAMPVSLMLDLSSPDEPRVTATLASGASSTFSATRSR